MNSRRIPWKSMSALLVIPAALACLGIALGIAEAQPQPVPVPPVIPPRAADDGPVVIPGELHVTYTGEIKLIDDNEFVLKLADEDRKRFDADRLLLVVSPQTEIMLNKEAATIDDLEPNDTARVTVNRVEGKTALKMVVARVVRTSEPERSERPLPAARREKATRTINVVKQPHDVLWQGRVFIAPAPAGRNAAQEGFRPGDMILFVGPDQILPSANVIPRVKLIDTGQRTGFVIESSEAATSDSPGVEFDRKETDIDVESKPAPGPEDKRE